MWFLQNTVSQGSSGAHARDLRAEVSRPLQTHLPMAWDGAASPSHTTDTRAGGVVIWRDMQRVASWDSSTGLRWWGEDQHFSSGRTMGGQPPQSHGNTLADTSPATPSSHSKNPVLPVALWSDALHGPPRPLDRQPHNTVSAWTAPQEGKKCRKYTDGPLNSAKNASRLQKLPGDIS